MKSSYCFAKIAVSTVILLLSSSTLFSQLNLVTNPSFILKTLAPVPTRDTNPMGMHWIVRMNNTPRFPLSVFNDPAHVTNWFRANQATSDYYHSAASPTFPPFTDTTGVKVPKIWAQDKELWGAGGTSDSAYAGIQIVRFPGAFYENGERDYREYITTKLGQHLKSGKEYLVQFKYATNDYVKTGLKGRTGQEKSGYYLKRLGVAFASNENYVDYDSTGDWKSPGLHKFIMPMYLGAGNYIDVRELPYAYPNTWETFATRFRCYDSTLQYIIIGNFDHRIALNDIGIVPRNSDTVTGKISYEFYTFIDSVVVKEIETGSCNCTSIDLTTNQRDSTLEASHTDQCCFTTTIAPTPLSCKFWGVRVSLSGVPVSSPSTKYFDHAISDTETVDISFCIANSGYETGTNVTFEFLKADSSVLCTQNHLVYCNCTCGAAQRGFIRSLFVPVAPDSGNCCWEFSIINDGSCGMLPSSASINSRLTFDFGNTITYTSIAPWIQIDTLDIHKFTSSRGFLPKYEKSDTTKIFKVCIDPKAANINRPRIFIGLADADNYYQNDYCVNLVDKELLCIESDNCCDKLNIELNQYSIFAHDCALAVVLSNKSSNSKCDVFGARIINNGDTLYTLNPQDTALNLSTPKQIWSNDLGGCQYEPIPSNWGKTRIYTIEILDSTGAVKCSVTDTFRCCPQQGLALKQPLQEDEREATPLSVGGVINDAIVEGNTLHYSLKNMGDDLSATIQLTDLKGNILTLRKLNLTKGNSAGEFDVSHLSSGTYFISVHTDLWQTSRQLGIVK